MGVGIGAFMPGGALCGCMRCMTAANICGFMGMSDLHFLESFREADAFGLWNDAFRRHRCGFNLRNPGALGYGRVMCGCFKQAVLLR